MCRWLAYQGAPIYLDQLIYEPEHSLVHQSLQARKGATRVNADGFGIGWYTERKTPGQFHEVLPAWGDANLRSLAHHICSHRFMAHVRCATGTQVSRSNCHPFIIENWMFLHNGQIGEFSKVKYHLECHLTEQWYLLREGSTDSELIFLLMMQNGLQSDPVHAIQKTIADIEQAMLEKGVGEPFKASMCVSDGEQFWVVRYSSDTVPPTVFMEISDGNATLASEPLTRQPGWESVPAQSLLHINGDNVTTYTITSLFANKAA